MPNFQRTAIGGVALLALALGGCSTQRPAAPRDRAPAVGRALNPAAYVATAGSIDLFVTRASALATSRSSDGGVRALAGRLSEEHGGLGVQLSLAGRRLNALPGARMMPREEQRFAWLETQQPFDTTYVRQMLIAHEQAIALHAAFAAHGSSATLRPVAVNAERVERAHYAALRGR